ncbi:sodium:solute symporter [Paraburkholderia sediminicola]|uniref:sodium:solute symporter n=1 Tax=Paraburkholderia sediminicola TaxID=458836 RepID=UPI0038BD09E0
MSALLVSASYGVAFLLGSGEMAMHFGMAGSLYPVVTALGMIALATFAGRLWRAAELIWDVLGNAYGDVTRKGVALLSLTWMAGVLAAQIHGGVAVLTVAGVPRVYAPVVMVVALLAASSVEIGVAAGFFACGLLASNMVLFRTVVQAGGLHLYVHAVPEFIRDARVLPSTDLLTTVVAVGFLVITGADYQQFIIAARRPMDAVAGCLIAALFLLVTGFLPAAAVIAAHRSGQLVDMPDAAEAIPMLLLQVAHKVSRGAGLVSLGVLLAAALGSGAAIARAMTGALAATLRAAARHQYASRILVVAAGSAIAVDGQTIISTIASLNIVYIAAIGLPFILYQAGRPVGARCASWMLKSGALVSLSASAMSWVSPGITPAWSALPAGLLASGAAGLWHAVIRTRSATG